MSASHENHHPTSIILDSFLAGVSEDHVTLAWILGNLRERSFGVLLLIIALVGLLPGVTIFAALLLLVPAFQMILARPFPVLPSRIASRRLSTRSIARLIRHTTPAIRWLERFTYPRWPTPFESTKRVVGLVVMLLALSLLSPMPFMHLIPAVVIMLIAFSFLEKDGLLLSISLLLGVLSLAITAASVWIAILAVDSL